MLTVGPKFPHKFLNFNTKSCSNVEQETAVNVYVVIRAKESEHCMSIIIICDLVMPVMVFLFSSIHFSDTLDNKIKTVTGVSYRAVTQWFVVYSIKQESLLYHYRAVTQWYFMYSISLNED